VYTDFVGACRRRIVALLCRHRERNTVQHGAAQSRKSGLEMGEL